MSAERPVQKHEIREAYDRIARWFDLFETVPELLGVRRMRRRALRLARGRVLEVAAGTGKNFAFYPAATRVVGVDLSIEMLRRARRRAARLPLPAAFAVMDGEALAVPDATFDTVVSSLTLCTFPDPLAALREMRRACRADGRILLVEHGRSERDWLARFQDRHELAHARTLGCHWNREPLELVRQAGLTVERADRAFLGIFHLIVARPEDRATSLRDRPARQRL